MVKLWASPTEWFIASPSLAPVLVFAVLALLPVTVWMLSGKPTRFSEKSLTRMAWPVRQYFVAVPDMQSVGVKDGKRYMGWPAIIRAVNTTDAMTATVEEVPYPLLHHITARITSEVDGINRVLMDLTPKPVGTIEWE